MAKINVEILGRHLGTAMSSEEKSYQAFTVYAFHPAHGVMLPDSAISLSIAGMAG
jgi:hypothetical protein